MGVEVSGLTDNRVASTIGVQAITPAAAVTSFLTAERVEQASVGHDTRRLRLFSGTSNQALAREIGRLFDRYFETFDQEI